MTCPSPRVDDDAPTGPVLGQDLRLPKCPIPGQVKFLQQVKFPLLLGQLSRRSQSRHLGRLASWWQKPLANTSRIQLQPSCLSYTGSPREC